MQNRSKKLKVLIVDDHPVVRRGLSDVILDEEDMEVSGEAADGAEALKKVQILKPDVAIVDISLGATSGIDLIKEIRLRHPDVAVLVVSMHDELLFAERSLEAGALGYINKNEALDTVVDGIRAVANGDIFLSQPMAQHIIERTWEGVKDADRSPIEALSDRELEVFGLMGHGLTTRQIADKLHLSTKTIETHRQHIKEKLGLRSNRDVVRRAVHWLLNHP